MPSSFFKFNDGTDDGFKMCDDTMSTTEAMKCRIRRMWYKEVKMILM